MDDEHEAPIISDVNELEDDTLTADQNKYLQLTVDQSTAVPTNYDKSITLKASYEQTEVSTDYGQFASASTDKDLTSISTDKDGQLASISTDKCVKHSTLKSQFNRSVGNMDLKVPENIALEVGNQPMQSDNMHQAILFDTQKEHCLQIIDLNAESELKSESQDISEKIFVHDLNAVTTGRVNKLKLHENNFKNETSENYDIPVYISTEKKEMDLNVAVKTNSNQSSVISKTDLGREYDFQRCNIHSINRENLAQKPSDKNKISPPEKVKSEDVSFELKNSDPVNKLEIIEKPFSGKETPKVPNKDSFSNSGSKTFSDAEVRKLGSERTNPRWKERMSMRRNRRNRIEKSPEKKSEENAATNLECYKRSIELSVACFKMKQNEPKSKTPKKAIVVPKQTPPIKTIVVPKQTTPKKLDSKQEKKIAKMVKTAVTEVLENWQFENPQDMASGSTEALEQNVKSSIKDNNPTNVDKGMPLSKTSPKEMGSVPKHASKTIRKSPKENQKYNIPSGSGNNLERKFVQRSQTSEKSNLPPSESTLQREMQNKTSSLESEQRISQQLHGLSLSVPCCDKPHPDKELCTILSNIKKIVDSSEVFIRMKKSSQRTEQIKKLDELSYTEPSQRLNVIHECKFLPERSDKAGGKMEQAPRSNKTGDAETSKHSSFMELHSPILTAGETLNFPENSSKQSCEADPPVQDSLCGTRKQNVQEALNSEEMTIKTECPNLLTLPSLTDMKNINWLLTAVSEAGGSGRPSERHFEESSETENEHHFDPKQDEKNIKVSKKKKKQKRKK